MIDGRALREARTASGMTQLELASKVGISRERLSAIENNGGGVNATTLFRLCSALGADVREIWREEDDVR